MPRKPSQAPAPIEVEINAEAIAEGQAARNQLAVLHEQDAANVKTLASQLGYTGRLDADSLESVCKAKLVAAQQGIFEFGASLLLLRESCLHGDWHERLERIGVAPRTAVRYITIAAKLKGTDVQKALQNLGMGKVLELAAFDDGEIQALTDGESVRGLTLDQFEKMSLTDLRKKLREAQEKIIDKDRVLADKTGKINELDEQLTRARRQLQIPSWDERVAPFQKEITERQSVLDAAIAKHLEAIKALDAWMTGEITSAPDYDPETPVVLPPAVRAVVLHLDDAVSRTATLAAEMQRELRLRFGADIDDVRQNVLTEEA